MPTQIEWKKRQAAVGFVLIGRFPWSSAGFMVGWNSEDGWIFHRRQ
jgi:hypothetical protein